MKPTRANVKRVAEGHGAIIDDGGIRYKTVDIWLPKGKVWRATGGHVLSTGSYVKLDADCWADILNRMGYGVDSGEDCGDPNCDVCFPADDE